MHNANIHEAKTHLSKLIEAVLAGEDVIISRAGKPLIRLIPYEGASKPRTPGGWEGRIVMTDDFDECSPEINAMFYGEMETEKVKSCIKKGAILAPFSRLRDSLIEV